MRQFAQPDGTTASWQFSKQQPGQPTRNPISGEFFASDGVKDVSGALARESLQNSLDAALSPHQTVTVKIRIATGHAALESPKAKDWFRALWRHLEAPNSGIKDSQGRGSPCPFVVIEDFGTEGLTGDPTIPWRTGPGKNNFLNFFRAEGESDKGAGARGSWGIGKAIFARASRINSYFGLTVPENGTGPLLMGRSILKFHEIDGERFISDGFWGLTRSDGLVLPAFGNEIDRFRSEFNLERTTQSGLSVVVPFIAETGSDAPTFRPLRRAVIESFYLAILRGRLTVYISDGENNVKLDQDSIIPEIEDGDDQEIRAEILASARLALRSLKYGQEDYIEVLPTNAPPTWNSALVPELSALARKLEAGESAAIRIPLPIKQKEGAVTQSHFQVFMATEPNTRLSPHYFNKDLRITGIRRGKARGVRSLIVADDPALSKFLTDSENPAHTTWNQNSGNFRGKYLHGTETIAFIVNSAAKLSELLTSSEQAVDRHATASFFPDLTKKRPSKRPGGGSQIELPPPRDRALRIAPINGGFRIAPGKQEATGKRFVIEAAYDVRNGNPFARYSPVDFDFRNAGLTILATGQARIEEIASNTFVFGVDGGDFQVEAAGFDANRDIIVRYREGPPTNGDQAV